MLTLCPLQIYLQLVLLLLFTGHDVCQLFISAANGPSAMGIVGDGSDSGRPCTHLAVALVGLVVSSGRVVLVMLLVTWCLLTCPHQPPRMHSSWSADHQVRQQAGIGYMNTLKLWDQVAASH